MTITVPTRVAALIATAAIALGLGAAYLAGDAHASGTSTLVTQPASDATAQGITVSGLGRVTGTPDVLHVQLSVDVRRPDIDTALSAANATLSHVSDALRKSGVAAKDLQTSGLSIQRAYSTKGAPNGYEVSESLEAKLRNLTRAGRTISSAVDAGGNAVRLDSLFFDLEGDTALVAAARSAAFAEAKTKAQQYADAAGSKLGGVTSISEQVVAPPNIYGGFDGGTGTAGGQATRSVPIQAGTQDVTVTVTVNWSLR